MPRCIMQLPKGFRFWFEAEGRSGMPRAGVSVEGLVRAAAELADEVGFDEVTVSALARGFDVTVASLYSHIRNAEDLRIRVAALALTELADRAARARTPSSPSPTRTAATPRSTRAATPRPACASPPTPPRPGPPCATPSSSARSCARTSCPRTSRSTPSACSAALCTASRAWKPRARSPTPATSILLGPARWTPYMSR